MNNTQYSKYLFDKIKSLTSANPGVTRETYGKGENLTHKFLIKGHTQNEGDSVHSLIERKTKQALKSGPVLINIAIK